MKILKSLLLSSVILFGCSTEKLEKKSLLQANITVPENLSQQVKNDVDSLIKQLVYDGDPTVVIPRFSGKVKIEHNEIETIPDSIMTKFVNLIMLVTGEDQPQILEVIQDTSQYSTGASDFRYKKPVILGEDTDTTSSVKIMRTF